MLQWRNQISIRQRCLVVVVTRSVWVYVYAMEDTRRPGRAILDRCVVDRARQVTVVRPGIGWVGWGYIFVRWLCAVIVG
jgi:hypothetical protein